MRVFQGDHLLEYGTIDEGNPGGHGITRVTLGRQPGRVPCSNHLYATHTDWRRQLTTRGWKCYQDTVGRSWGAGMLQAVKRISVERLRQIVRVFSSCNRLLMKRLTSAAVTSILLTELRKQSIYLMTKTCCARVSRRLVLLRLPSSLGILHIACLMWVASVPSVRSGSTASRMSPRFSFWSLSRNMTNCYLRMRRSIVCRKP